MKTKTKIIATIGPASNNKETLKKMIQAGVNVVRLNFSHGTYEQHGDVIKMIRSLSRELNQPVGILLDLQGPKVRTGKLKNGAAVPLVKNSIFKITSQRVTGTSEIVGTTYKNLPNDVKAGDKILVDDGLIELKVMESTPDTVTCKVRIGGMLKENKGINLPGVQVSAPSLTEKDKKDLRFGIQNNVDYVALSFVRQAEDLQDVKDIIKRMGSDIPVVAKIEKPEAVDNIDDILAVTDAVMVARGDLGVEMQYEKVPTIQKMIIQKAIAANKPVITATQMLESMIQNPIPTRAEASDVANAIMDGTDAVMLSGETASGQYPVEAVKMMSKIAIQAERSQFLRYNIAHAKDHDNIITQAVAQSAVDMVRDVGAKAIIAFSVSGSTSKYISKHRPSRRVYAFTPSTDVYNRLALVWGLAPTLISKIQDTKKLMDAAENLLVRKGVLKPEDLVVIITGLALKTGSTNMIKIHRVGQAD
jgi:pyruvate kinase